jgi:hypothetical protein
MNLFTKTYENNNEPFTSITSNYRGIFEYSEKIHIYIHAIRKNIDYFPNRKC